MIIKINLILVLAAAIPRTSYYLPVITSLIKSKK